MTKFAKPRSVLQLDGKHVRAAKRTCTRLLSGLPALNGLFQDSNNVLELT